LGLVNLRKKLVKCYFYNVALYCAETWDTSEADQKYQESFEVWYWRRTEKISWTSHVRNGSVAQTQGGEKYPSYSEKKTG
jgi:hypothetical protein